MKKQCELCKQVARIHCWADQASLCWDCDAKVHSANFLSARHSRNLLCHVCQSLLTWSAAGSSLEPTVAICQLCFYGEVRKRKIQAESSSYDENAAVKGEPPDV
ncbi:B-box type zinc finger family protein [Striga asiatica]|uniref:B-box type zinc finger family protein n=1 Tax=Striga asiatica TaxID=4170 RepID=A0A5A7QD84_STRAF|nr:B-box type zinc finger family protein [Striga asiatica]